MAPWMSAPVEATVRAVKVEALKVCSAYRIIETSKLLMTSGCGTLPKTMWKKFSQKGSADPARSAPAPWTSRLVAATAVGIFASSRMAFRRCAASETSAASGSSVPMKDTAVRIASIGCASFGMARSTESNAGETARLPRSSAWNALSCAMVGSSPCQRR